jgi:hypothetical protein
MEIIVTQASAIRDGVPASPEENGVELSKTRPPLVGPEFCQPAQVALNAVGLLL